MGIISVVLTILSIGGAIWNARGSIWGFFIWVPANVGWIIYDIAIEQYAQAVLFVVYTGICGYGIYQWRKNNIGRHKEEGS